MTEHRNPDALRITRPEGDPVVLRPATHWWAEREDGTLSIYNGSSNRVACFARGAWAYVEKVFDAEEPAAETPPPARDD